MKLDRTFFQQSTVTVAQLLLGASLVRRTTSGTKVGLITETEAYPPDDPASHAFRGKTNRNQIMWQAGGFVYIYLIYGVHHCLNLTTEALGVPGAVLIRNVIPILGFENQKPVVGPGRVTKAFGISLADNGVDATVSDQIFVEKTDFKSLKFETVPRVGISRAQDKPWRFKLG